MWSQDYEKLYLEVSVNKKVIPGLITNNNKVAPVLIKTDSTGRHTIGSQGVGYEDIWIGDSDGSPQEFFITDCKSMDLWWAYPPECN
jgi:hypothetical protein